MIIGATSMAPSAIELQAGGELLGRVAEHELQVELLGDAEHRRQRVGLHAHADDDDAALRRRDAHQLVDHAGHADGLEHGHLAIAADAGPRRERGLLARVDDLVGAHRDAERAAGGGEVGGDDRGHAEQAQGGDHGEPDRPAADDDGAVARLQPGPVDGVQADGHRLGERGVRRGEAVGHRQRQQRRQQHALAVAARQRGSCRRGPGCRWR